MESKKIVEKEEILFQDDVDCFADPDILAHVKRNTYGQAEVASLEE